MSETMSDPMPAHEVVRAALAMHAAVIALAVPVVWLQASRRGVPCRGPSDSHGATGPVRGAVLVLSAVMLAGFSLGGFEIATALHVRGPLGFGSRAVAAVFVVCGLAMLVAQLGLLPRFALRPDRMGWALGLLLGIAGLLVAMPLATSQSVTLGIAGLIGGGLGLAIALLGLQTAALTGRRRGFALGLQSSVANAGQAIGSVSAGALFAALDHGAFAALTLAVAPLTLILIEAHRRVAASIRLIP